MNHNSAAASHGFKFHSSSFFGGESRPTDKRGIEDDFWRVVFIVVFFRVSLQYLEVRQNPFPVEVFFRGRVEAEVGKLCFASDGGYSVFFKPLWCSWAKI